MANRLYLIPDHHDERPRFHFEEYASALADGFLNPRNRTPWVTAVYGPWGSGKTTLLRRVEAIIDEAQHRPSEDARPVRTVWFNAWKYGSEDTVLAGLLRALLAAMKEEGWKAEGAAEFVRSKVEAGGLGGLAIKVFRELMRIPSIAAGIGSAGAGLCEPQGAVESRQAYYDQFEELFGQLVEAWLDPRKALRDREGGWRSASGEDGVVVVFVDDLDRCRADRVVGVFEAVKLFLDQPRVAVVVAADRGPLLERLAEAYGDRAERYLEKVVQVAFDLPTVYGAESKEYAESLVREHPLRAEIRAHLDLIVEKAEEADLTPRGLKAFINDLTTKIAILQSLGQLNVEEWTRGRPSVGHVVAFHLLLRRSPELLRPVLRRGDALRSIRKEAGRLRNMEAGELQRALAEMPVTPEMKEFLKDRESLELLEALPEHETAVQILAQNAAPPERARRAATRANTTMVNLFPESVVVSAGAFGRGEANRSLPDAPPQIVDVSGFEIDRTPVTNSQYAFFMHGMQGEKGCPPPPQNWPNGVVPEGKEEHPVVFVSWEDATAYCEWRSKVSGQEWRLPTEAEWEKAARGTDRRPYPWGAEAPSVALCNFGRAVGEATPVGQHPGGQSPYGCLDMAGNVWEWCADWYEADYYGGCPTKDPRGAANGAARVLRGGSWLDHAGALRTALRNSAVPAIRIGIVGFRAARSLPRAP